jgi:hypothetical protein
MKEFIVTILFFLVEINLLGVESYKLDIEPVAPVYWISKEEIFVNELERAYIFNTQERIVTNEYEKEENQVLGYEYGKLYACEWSNREITSPEEYSTLLKFKEGDQEYRRVGIRPTVEVVVCREEIVLRTVFPLEEKMFVFKEELSEIKRLEEGYISPTFTSFYVGGSLGEYYINRFVFSLPQLF